MAEVDKVTFNQTVERIDQSQSSADDCVCVCVCAHAFVFQFQDLNAIQ